MEKLMDSKAKVPAQPEQHGGSGNLLSLLPPTAFLCPNHSDGNDSTKMLASTTSKLTDVIKQRYLHYNLMAQLLFVANKSSCEDGVERESDTGAHATTDSANSNFHTLI